MDESEDKPVLGCYKDPLFLSREEKPRSLGDVKTNGLGQLTPQNQVPQRVNRKPLQYHPTPP